MVAWLHCRLFAGILGSRKAAGQGRLRAALSISRPYADQASFRPFSIADLLNSPSVTKADCYYLIDDILAQEKTSVARVKKAALFVRCTEEEAEKIRRTAKAERRTVSGFVLNAVFNRIAVRERLQSEQEQQESKIKGLART